MKTRVIHAWKALNSSLWFIPGIMTALAIGLSFTTVPLDGAMKERFAEKVDWLWAGGPEGAREILSAIATSMITVAGVVFSITVVVLTLASSQFGPRLLRSFMRDRGNQIVLGTFIATFTYCLLVLRTVRGENGGDEFAPYISVTVAILLALASLGVLIYFIHHVSRTIQAPIVIAKVAEDLLRGVERIFPEKLGEGGDNAETQLHVPPDLERDGWKVPSRASGYLQAIDNAGLLEVATERDLVIQLMYRPGRFIMEGSVLALVWPRRTGDEPVADKINEFFILGPERTEEQDVEFIFNQLAEIAVRALSPSINDPFTALACVDHLGAGLSRVAGRRIPSPLRYDKARQLRVIACGPTFDDFANVAFDPIRHYGRSSAPVMIGLLERLAALVHYVRRNEDRRTVLRHAALAKHASSHGLVEEVDRLAVEERYQKVLLALGETTTAAARSSDRAGLV